ncbi:unnamed protein product, partial [Owenia fusiformis]
KMFMRTSPTISLLLCGFMFIPRVNLQKNESPKIAIVGGGAGGVSSGHFLRELFDKHVQIDLYEDKEIGGRVSSVKFAGQDYESGGSVIHPKNMYMVNMTKMLGLKPRAKAHGILGIYNGEEMDFTGSSFSLVTMAKMFWRYGYDLIRLDTWNTHLLEKFSSIYDHQIAGHAFTSVEKLLESMSQDMRDLLYVSAEKKFKEEGFSERFINELALGALRNNYGQSTDIQAFVCSVSLAGAMPGLWEVHGGNNLVFKQLVKHASINHIHAKVQSVTLTSTNSQSPRYILEGVNRDNVPFKDMYDIVIIATPLHDKISDIKFNGFPKPVSYFPGEYKRTVANFVHGTPNITKFGFDNLNDFPTMLLTANRELYYRSIGKQFPVNWGGDGKAFLPSVWKVFSEEPLTESEFDDLFLSYDQTTMVDWRAYPKYGSTDNIPPFQLAQRLYYVNGIEWAASAMETSVIGGKNVALLAYNQWMGLHGNIDQEVHVKHDKTELDDSQYENLDLISFWVFWVNVKAAILDFPS